MNTGLAFKSILFSLWMLAFLPIFHIGKPAMSQHSVRHEMLLEEARKGDAES
jgi:hypothetical protein